jgi:hypothetical protein
MVTNDARSGGLPKIDYLQSIMGLVRTGETANLQHWRDGMFVVGEDGTWHYEGFVNLFQALHEAMRMADPSIPPGLPPHVLDPVVITSFFGIARDDMNWQGRQSGDNLAERPGGMEKKLDSKKAIVPEADFVSIKQAATITQLSESHLRRAVWSRALPAANAGTPAHPIWRIARNDLIRWLQARMGGTSLPPKSEIGDLVSRYFPED